MSVVRGDAAPSSAAALPGAVTLLSTVAVRERCGRILEAARAGCARWFELDEARLDDAADLVAAVTRRRYPDLRVPYHSRWRHFEAGGADRVAAMEAAAGASLADPAERARARIDLAVVSVLLDAGAGAAWRFEDRASGTTLGRSEGLGVASLRAFETGLFSSDPRHPWRADAAGLARVDAAALGAAFQVSAANPLVGLDGRVALLRRLGEALAARPEVFGAAARPGGLFDALRPDGAARLAAHDLLVALLTTLGGIWPQGARIGGLAVGDAWRHPLAGGEGETAGWVPFHKLSQWLCYSLLEPFESAGVAVDGLDALTGLAEYRNGGLLVDAGVLRPRDPSAFASPLPPGAEPVVEWRALTVALVDALAPKVRARLGADARAMPLAAVLEGGTWAAGRELAAARRGGEPPFAIASDGTVF
ncbi:MAG: URC4/urg3 family protein [Burkholderiales bacterium]